MNDKNTAAPTVATISDKTEEGIRAAYKALHHLLLSHIVDNKLPEPTFQQDFGKCNAEDYKAIHLMANGTIRAKDLAREAQRVAPLLTGLQGLRDTYTVRAREAKKTFDALPAEVRQFMPAFPTNITIPATEVAKVWPSATPASTIARDLMSDSLKKSLSYNVGKDGSLSFAFVAEPVKAVAKAA